MSPFRVLPILIGVVLLCGCIAAFSTKSRPQDPLDRPYAIEAVQFRGGGGVLLSGELTRPATSGPHKALILISGSGPQDRDEALAGHRPFLVISDHLTKAGFAVLRYDDRGVGDSEGQFQGATIHDFADDAAGAYRFLEARQDINPQKIGFLGHSEGGYIAPQAAKSVSPAFMVFLAGPARPFVEVLATQAKDVLVAEGAAPEQANLAHAQYLNAQEILSRGDNPQMLRQQMAAYLTSLGLSEDELEANLEFIMDPWVLAYAKHDTRAALRVLEMPVLALFGSKDVQVSAETEAPEMRRLLRHPQSFVEVFAGLNHLFQPADTGLPDEYEQIETTISPKVLARIIQWLQEM